MFSNGVKLVLQMNLPLSLKLLLQKNNQNFQSGK